MAEQNEANKVIATINILAGQGVTLKVEITKGDLKKFNDIGTSEGRKEIGTEIINRQLQLSRPVRTDEYLDLTAKKITLHDLGITLLGDAPRFAMAG